MVYLPSVVMNALGKPNSIDIFTRGSNIGLFPSSNGGGYRVTQQKDFNGNHHRTTLPYISLSALVKQWNIKPGVYEAHIEDGGVVFDTRQSPSKPVY